MRFEHLNNHEMISLVILDIFPMAINMIQMTNVSRELQQCKYLWKEWMV